MRPELAIERLRREGPTPERLDAFFRDHAFPVVEGVSVTFVWRGQAAGVVLRHWVYGLETSNELVRLPDTDVFYLVLEIPRGSRVEYKFEVHRDGGSTWVQDPLNPHHARDPFGANSVLQAEGYCAPEWSRHDPAAREGHMEPTRFRSRALAGDRHATVYLPARFRRSRRYPLLVVHDGSDYLNYAGLKTVLDNLIHRLELPELIAVFLDSPDRLREYADHEAHARFLTEELAPRLARRLPLIDAPHARCLMGASFGAVASLSTAIRFPGTWGRLLLQSGSFAFSDIGTTNWRGPLFDRIVAFMNDYRAAPTVISERIYMSCGVYESLIYENRSLAPLLAATGMQVRLSEARDGHNWEGWRDRVREGLSFLFPGPLMFVYE